MYSEYCNNHAQAVSELQQLYMISKYAHFFEVSIVWLASSRLWTVDLSREEPSVGSSSVHCIVVVVS